MQDFDNFYFARFWRGDDKLQVYKVDGGDYTELVSGDTISGVETGGFYRFVVDWRTDGIHIELRDSDGATVTVVSTGDTALTDGGSGSAGPGWSTTSTLCSSKKRIQVGGMAVQPRSMFSPVSPSEERTDATGNGGRFVACRHSIRRRCEPAATSSVTCPSPVETDSTTPGRSSTASPSAHAVRSLISMIES